MKLNLRAITAPRSIPPIRVNDRPWPSWFFAALLLLTFNPGQAQAATIDLETRTELQLTLQQYIDAGTVDGVYEHFNLEQGAIVKLRLKTLHPVIFVVENKYMLCADFMDANGESVMLDYIVGPSSDGFRVEQEIIGRRSYLQQIFERIL